MYDDSLSDVDCAFRETLRGRSVVQWMLHPGGGGGLMYGSLLALYQNLSIKCPSLFFCDVCYCFFILIYLDPCCFE